MNQYHVQYLVQQRGQQDRPRNRTIWATSPIMAAQLTIEQFEHDNPISLDIKIAGVNQIDYPKDV